jgi:hypothetical protein
MSHLPPLSSDGKENLSHIADSKATAPQKTASHKTIKVETSAKEIFQSQTPTTKTLPERPVQIDEATLIKRWKTGGNWCKDENEAMQKLSKEPFLSFSIWSSIPTSWSVALSSGETMRISKGLTDPVASARALSIRENQTLFVSESSVEEARNAMHGLYNTSFFLRETSTKSNPNEFTLEFLPSGETKTSNVRILCTESGYSIASTKGPINFTSLNALLSKLSLSQENSLYNSLYDTMKKEFEYIGYHNVSYLKRLDPFVQNVALDVISDTVQSKDTMKTLIFKLTEE